MTFENVDWLFGVVVNCGSSSNVVVDGGGGAISTSFTVESNAFQVGRHVSTGGEAFFGAAHGNVHFAPLSKMHRSILHHSAYVPRR